MWNGATGRRYGMWSTAWDRSGLPPPFCGWLQAGQTLQWAMRSRRRESPACSFQKAGTPSEHRCMVFNGDLVDRGAWCVCGCGIIGLFLQAADLAAFKLIILPRMQWCPVPAALRRPALPAATPHHRLCTPQGAGAAAAAVRLEAGGSQDRVPAARQSRVHLLLLGVRLSGRGEWRMFWQGFLYGSHVHLMPLGVLVKPEVEGRAGQGRAAQSMQQ